MASTSPSKPDWRALAGRGRRPTAAGQLRRARPPGHVIVTVIILALALAFYLWTAATSIPFDFSSNLSDVYNLMTTGLLHGHLDLPLHPPPGLVHLRDPYDPAQNAPYQAAYHDLALRGGHLYSTWGVSPVLLFGLFRLTPWDLPQSFAVAVYAFLGLACAVGLLHVLVRRWLPHTPGWLLVLASAALALTNAVPFLLRRPAQYEVAISGGYCFEMAGILLVVTAVLSRRVRLTRLAFGSLMLGLALAARPTLAAGGLAAPAAAGYLIRRRGASWRVLVPALVPVIACGVLLGAYNDLRFGSPAEFGQHYQLAGLDVQHKPTDQLAYVAPGMFGYLLEPARLSLTFPHVFLSSASHYPFALPAGYSGTSAGGAAEPVGGMLTTMPITLLLFALPFLWLARRRAERAPLLAATGLAALSLAVIGLLSYALWGTTQRYEVDFATFALLSAFLVWALLIERAGARKPIRSAIVAAGIGLSAFGAAAGTAVSFTGYYNALQLAHPGTFNTLEAITSPLVTLATIVGGHPVLTRVSAPPAVALAVSDYGAIGDPGAGLWLGAAGPVTLTVIAPHGQNLDLIATASLAPGAPPRAHMVILVQSPGQPRLPVPLISAGIRLPLRLHWGLNRIRLTLAPNGSQLADQLLLSRLTLSG